jgi:integrase/recombinase XerD
VRRPKVDYESRTLDLYIDQRISGPIFLGANGARMDRYAADRTVKRLARRAGISKRISPHSLRHSFITAALDAGVPLRDV